MREIETQIEINASPAEVWKVLMEFEAYKDWNPFITQISGEKSPDSTLTILIDNKQLPPQTINPIVKVVTQDEKFCWQGKLLADWVFSGKHYFKMKRSETI